MENTKDISIVISLFNEEESLPELVRWIGQVMDREGYTYEIIMTDDGSTDSSWQIIRELSRKNANIRGISFRRNYGKSAALYCGFKAAEGRVVVTMDADLQDSPEVYGEMHRYIPYLAKNAGFTRITEIPVHHQKRKYGKSKFGIERFVNGFLDLLSLWFLSTFGKKPMHLFGFTGILMFIIGGIIAIWIIASKLIEQSHGLPFRPVTEQPVFYLALVTIILGFQMFLAGFIGELISRNSSERNHYNIREEF